MAIDESFFYSYIYISVELKQMTLVDVINFGATAAVPKGNFTID